jgi:hypothetical protein
MNVADHYWIVGGSTTDVYQSKTNTLVAVGDAAYVAWAATNLAAPIANENELAVMVRANGLQLPEWLFLSADTFIQPTPTTYSKGQLAAYSADARNRHATGGMIITSLSPVPFLTDTTSRNTINSSFQYSQANPAHITNWKMSDGTFIPLNNTQMATLNNDVTVFVQSCFTCESTNLTAINGGSMTTLAAIDAAYAAISSTVP